MTNVGGAKLDWDRLKVFQTVADTGSINAASKTLCLSYGKVSKDLEELERMLGHQLFERSSRGLELTNVGEDILRSARNMADSVQSIIERANESAPDHLVICAREGIATYWLARRMSELLALEPEMRVFLKVLPTAPNWAASWSTFWQPGERGAHDKLATFLKGPAFDISKLQMRGTSGGGRPGAGT